MKKLRSIQALRGLAACAVVVLHVYPSPGQALGKAGFGASGVDLFFVISGFIMANVSRGRTPGEFVGDRVWRIYPLWWVAVLPWLFMVPRGLLHGASSVTLWPIYAGGYYFPVLKVGWTLSFEMLFYLGMTLAIARGRALPIAAYALFLLGAFTTSSSLLRFVGNPIALEFLMGTVIAKLPRRPPLGLLIPAGLSVIACTSPQARDFATVADPQLALSRVIEWGIPAAMVVWGALSLESVFEQRAFDAAVAIGDASYSIYLFHPLLAYGFNFSWPARLALALGVGWTMHLAVERRILAFRAR